MGAALLRICRLYPQYRTLIGNPPKRTNGLTTKPCASVWASANVPCNHTEIREKSLSQWLDISAITRRATSRNYWTQTMNELCRRMKLLRRKTLRCSCFTTDGRNIEEIGAVLRYRPSDAEWWSLPFGWGGLQPITAQHTHAPRVQKLRNASFLQNRREDTIQAERHADNAWKAL